MSNRVIHMTRGILTPSDKLAVFAPYVALLGIVTCTIVTGMSLPTRNHKDSGTSHRKASVRAFRALVMAQEFLVLNGAVASSNVWNANANVVEAMRSAPGTDVEGMDAYSFGLDCYTLHIAFMKVTVVSNSEFSGSAFGPESIKAI